MTFFSIAGERIGTESVSVGSNPLDLSARYSAAIKGYLSHGKDGYDMLMGRPVLAPSEGLPQLATLIKDHFHALEHVNATQGGGDAAGAEEPSVAVKQQLQLISSNPHVGTEGSGAAGHVCVCAQEDGRIRCLSAEEAQQLQAATASETAGDGKRFTILHFNDVYEIESRRQNPVGGVARFIRRLKDAPEGLVLFSGDALAPSIMSTVTKGEHMIKFLNMMNIKAACMGNHDFDFGADHLVKMTGESNFPWMLSNVTDAKTGIRLANGIESLIIEHEGVKIGLMGLIEEEWLATLATISRDEVNYIDYVEVGRRLNTELRAQGVDMVIALTHMRNPNDIRLAQEVPELDLILGGHDHDVFSTTVNGVPLIKSGTDFRNFTKIEVTVGAAGEAGKRVACTWALQDVNESDPEDEVAAGIVKEYCGELEKAMQKVLGVLGTPLDARFGKIRTQETNCSNWVADTVRLVTKADVAIINSGTLRADAIFPAGQFLTKDLFTLLPMLDDMMTIELTGAELLAALENGVSQYPKLEGRFPCVSGVRFSFDPSKPGGLKLFSPCMFSLLRVSLFCN